MKPILWKTFAAGLAISTAGCDSGIEGDFFGGGMSTEVDIVSAADPSRTIGIVTFEQDVTGVVAHFDIPANNVIPGGLRAIHIHENGSCEAADSDGDGVPEPAGAAGGHYNPTNVGHGIDDGPHVGDSDNYNYVFDDDGSFDGEVRFSMASLFELHPLMRDEGTAIVIHLGVDDMVTNPNGLSGIPIACGVISALATL